MRQVLPSLLKTLHRGQKSSICESGKGDEGGRPSEASCLPRSVFSKSSFPKLTPHISDNFCPRRADSEEEEGILIAAPQKVSARQRGKGSGDGPRYAAGRDATFQRWLSMHRKTGRYPSWGSFGSREASSWSTGRVGAAKEGILKGSEAGGKTLVRPNDPVTRQELATMTIVSCRRRAST